MATGSEVIAFFDDVDTFMLANTFSVAQLRHEVNQAEIKASVAEAYHGTEYQTDDDLFPWADYATACQEAIHWQQASKPKTESAPSWWGKVDIEGIKSRNDIVAVVEGYTRLRKAGKNFTGRCPVHQDKNPSLTVYPDTQTWHCFGCNQGGDVISFIQAVEHTDFKGAASILRV